MRGKHLLVLLIAPILLFLSACSWNDYDPPSGVTVTTSKLAPPTTKTTPPRVTVTETAPTPTVTVTVPVTTAKTIIPTVQPRGCADLGMNTDDWNTDRDTPTHEELELKPGSPLVHPMVDAPLVQVSAWSGPCFDTVMFTIDTPLIPDINNPEVGDRMWFDGSYETVSADGSGNAVSLAGNGDLRLVIYAPGSSWRHGDPARPVEPVDVGSYHRTMGDNFSVIQEVKGASDFEGQVIFGIGVDEERPFAVHFADNDGKTAVVVRVAHK